MSLQNKNGIRIYRMRWKTWTYVGYVSQSPVKLVSHYTFKERGEPIAREGRGALRLLAG